MAEDCGFLDGSNELKGTDNLNMFLREKNIFILK